jgi:NADPH:quinone reductase-like Zn-dependent oxidoreductase
MKAVVYTTYGPPDVLQLQEAQKPTPKDGEVLIKVHAASINASDRFLLKGSPLFLRFTSGLRRPKSTILGADIAGRVEAVGQNVREFRPGDEVFGDISGCGRGGFAEYVCAREDALVSKPSNIAFEAAAAVPMAAVTALQGLRSKGQIQPGQKILVYGASGGVGTFAVQLAKAFGAEVTAVCSTRNVDMARSIGADHIIDYAREDFTKSGRRYDLILAANGHHTLKAYKRALTPNGACIVTGGSMTQIFQALLLGPLVSMAGSNTMGSLASQPNTNDLAFIKGLLEAGKVIPMIDRCFPLSEAAEAFRYLEATPARGKVVITV